MTNTMKNWLLGAVSALALLGVAVVPANAVTIVGQYEMNLDLNGDGSVDPATLILPAYATPTTPGNVLVVRSLQQSGTTLRPGPDSGDVNIVAPDEWTYNATIDCLNCQVDQFWYEIGEYPAGGPFNVPPIDVEFNRVMVQFPNTPPVANDDAYVTDEDRAVSGNVLTNDFDCGGGLTAALTVGPAVGTLVLNANGSFTYTPPANYCGEVTFEYAASDDPDNCDAESDTAVVTITVNPVNDAPTLAGLAPIMVMEDGGCVTINLASGAADVDDLNGCDCDYPATAPTTFTFEIVTQPTRGTLTETAPGVYEYCPNENNECDDSFQVRVTDDCGLSSAPITVEIDMIPQNDCPSLVGPVFNYEHTFLTSGWEPDGVQVQQVTWTEEQILSNFYDADMDPALVCANRDSLFYVVDAHPERNGSLQGVAAGIDLASGSVSVSATENPANATLNPDCLGQKNDVNVFLLVYDERSLLPIYMNTCPNKGEMLLRIRFENDTWENSDLVCPTAGFEFATDEDMPLTITDVQILAPMQALNPDADCNEILNIALWQNSLNWTETQFGGTASLDGSTLVYTPPENFPGACGSGRDSFPIWIASEHGDLIQCTVYVDVTAENDGPIAADDFVETCEDVIAPIAIADLLANDSDPDWGEGIAAFTGPAAPEFTVAGPGELLPESIGGYDMVPFDVQAQINAFAPYDVETVLVPGGICGNQLGIGGRQPSYRVPNDPLQPVTVLDMASWNPAIWGTGYAGPVYLYNYSNPATDPELQDEEIVMDLPVGTRAFSFYVQPGDHYEQTTNLIVYAYDNVGGTYMQNVVVQGTDAGAGARGIAVSTADPNKYLTRVVVYGSAYSELPVGEEYSGLAVGDFAIAMGGYGFVRNVGGALAPQNGELIIDSYVDPQLGDSVITSLQYRPYENFYGEDSFSYTFRVNNPDGSEDWGTGIVNVQVNPVSDLAPVASDDEFTGWEDVPLAIAVEDLLANDKDGGDSDLGVVAGMMPETLCLVGVDATSAQGGTVELIDGEIVYTPAENFYGEDTFTYVVTDQADENCEGVSDCNDGNEVAAEATGTVRICVMPENDPAIVQDDVFQTPMNVTLENNVLANDWDVEVDAGQSTWTAILHPLEKVSHGELSFYADGSFIYKPYTNWYGTDGFSYYAVDGGQTSPCGDSQPNVSEPVRVEILVGRENICPIAFPRVAVTDEDRPLTITLSGNDVEEYGFISRVVIGQEPANGTLRIPDGGLGNNVPAIYTPNANFCGADSFTYAVMDNNGCQSPFVTVEIAVNGVNDAPVAVDDEATVLENQSIEVYPMANDTDVDDGTACGSAIARMTMAEDPMHGTAILRNGKVTYTPNQYFVGEDQITYQVFDAAGASDFGTINVTVQRNELPIATEATFSTIEDKALTGQLSGFSSEGLPLRYDVVSAPANGTVFLTGRGQFRYMPVQDYYNSRQGEAIAALDAFTFTVTDTFGTSVEATVEIAVVADNDAPIANAQNPETLQNKPVDVILAGSDVDGDPLNFTIVEQPVNGTLTPVNETTWTYQPNLGFWGDDPFTFRVDDGTEASDVATVTVTVVPVDLVYGDWDDDGLADLATYQGVGGRWNVLQSAGGVEVKSFGSESMVPVPADYDGDGMLDHALYQRSSGNWYILYSSGGSWKFMFKSNTNMVPLPGDYDGDGAADLALFHQATAHWYVLGSTEGYSDVQFGSKTDIPVPADYDGDGVTDIAVYRPSSGNWYIIYSGGGSRVKQLGWAGTVPVPADYDGDGKADLAVLSRASSKWCIGYSGGGSLIKEFGYKTMTPVAADYDGDGKADIAMYHAASGAWYILQTSNGAQRKIVHGGPNQMPVLLYPLIHSWFGMP